MGNSLLRRGGYPIANLELPGGARGRYRGGGDDGEGLLDQGDRINRTNRSQEEELATLSEVLAPRIAKERGISEDEARTSLTSNVAPEETPMHWIGRQTLGRVGLMDREGPQGEPLRMRLARARGMGLRQDMNESDQDRNLKLADMLHKVADDLDDPSSLGGPMTSALRKGGADVPEGANVTLRRHRPRTMVELYQDDPAAAEKFGRMMHPGKAGGGDKPDKAMAQIDDLANVFLRTGKARDADEARAMAYRALKGGHSSAQPRATFEEQEYLNKLRNPLGDDEDLASSRDRALKAREHNQPSDPFMPAPAHDEVGDVLQDILSRKPRSPSLSRGAPAR